MISSVGGSAALREFIGRSLADFMRSRDETDPVEAVCDLLVETDLAAGFVAHGGSTEDGLRQCITHPAHLASTDAVLVGRPAPALVWHLSALPGPLRARGARAGAGGLHPAHDLCARGVLWVARSWRDSRGTGGGPRAL